jgi:uncharacterized protein YkwD
MMGARSLKIPALAVLLALAPPHASHAELTASEKRALLDQHNAWRARFSVAALAWDDGVARVAQEWADRLATSRRFEHRTDGRYGENLWTGTAGRFAMTAVVDAWGSEQKDFDIATNACARDKVCGHFTQVVWRSSTRLGCGKATGANGFDIVVCNYDPPGNFRGRSPFGR